jgi:hypothetical protein
MSSLDTAHGRYELSAGYQRLYLGRAPLIQERNQRLPARRSASCRALLGIRTGRGHHRRRLPPLSPMPRLLCQIRVPAGRQYVTTVQSGLQWQARACCPAQGTPEGRPCGVSLG